MNAPRNNRFPTLVPTRRSRFFAGIAAFLAVSLLQLEVTGALSLVGQARAQVAPGQVTRRMALIVVPKDAKKDATTAMVIRGLLRGAADRLAGAGLRRASMSEAVPDAVLAFVTDRVEVGFKALNGQKWDEALAAYKEAESALQPVLGLADRALVARTYKGLGVAFFQLRKQLQAKEAVRRSMLLYPGQKQIEYAFSLESRNLFTQIQKDVADAPDGSLDIQVADVAGAEVYVGGELRGFAPLKVSGLKLGDHLVSVFADGHEGWAQFVSIRGGSEQRLDVVMVPASNRSGVDAGVATILNGTDKGGALPADTRGLARNTGATDLVVLRVSSDKKGFVLQGVYGRGDQVVPLRENLSRDATLVSGLSDLLSRVTGMSPAPETALAPLESAPAVAMPEGGVAPASAGSVGAGGDDLMVDPNSPIFRDTGKKPKEFSVVKKWWFWTALVVGLGAVAGLTYWGVTAGGSGDAGGPSGDVKVTLRGIR
jgi:hypothetical protein